MENKVNLDIAGAEYPVKVSFLKKGFSWKSV